MLLTQLCFAQPVSPSANQGGWYWQNPLPQGNIIWSVKFTSSTVGWTVGQAGQGFVETKKMILIK